MKYVCMWQLVCCVTFTAYTAENPYIPLKPLGEEIILLDNDEDEKKPQHEKRTVNDLYKDGFRTVNQTLDISKQQVTAVSDLDHHRQSLQLTTLTTINVEHNYLDSEALCTIMREIPSLKLCNAGYNLITTIDNLPEHPTLETFLVHNNKIQRLNVGQLLHKLSALRQGNFRNNPFEKNDITEINGFNTHTEELWFDHDSLSEQSITQLITACPNLTSELMPGSRAVQHYYSETENVYDTFNCCLWCNGWHGATCFDDPVCICIIMPIIGAFIGLGVAGITMEVQNPVNPSFQTWLKGYTDMIEHRQNILGFYSSFCIPIGAVGVPLATRLLHRLYRYCVTPQHNRYNTVYTRQIQPQPTLLNLIADPIESAPSQEDTEEV